MKVKYPNGVVSSVRNDLGRELIKGGFAALVGESSDEVAARLPKFGDADPPIPQWEITTYHGVDRQYLAIKFSMGQRTEFYSGLPDEIRRIGGWLPPNQIVADYARQYRSNPGLRDTLAAAVQKPQTKNDENEQAGQLKTIRDGELREREQKLRTDLLAGRRSY